MALSKECLNNVGHSGCRAFSVQQCPPNCSGYIDDPRKYMKMLDDMEKYNSENAHSLAQIRKERKRVEAIFKKWDEDWYEVYLSERRRGSGGGSSEQDSNSATSLKQKMKDNRLQECKLTQAERQQIKEATEQWEAEHGKLEKLSRSPLSRNKVDSYTGEPIS